MSGLSTYAYLNARLRAKLGKLLSSEQYEELMRAADLEQACGVLRRTEYADIFKDVVSRHDLPRTESALVDHLISSHRDVAAHSKKDVRRFIEQLMRKYEVENLKVIFRVWAANEEKEFIYRKRICHEIPVDAILEAATVEEIIVLLEDTPYRKPLTEAREKYKERGSLFYLEVTLDRELHEATWKAIAGLSPSDRKIASRLVGIELDILNINWLLRFKRYYNLGLAEVTSLMLPKALQINEQFVREVYPGADPASLMSRLLTGVYKTVPEQVRAKDETQAMHLLEALLRQVFVEQVRNALSGFPFTIGVAIAYLRLKKMEVSNIVTILNAKALGVPQEQLESSVVTL
jgi:V/A-type H+-transporting ATPase subunit C